MYFSHWKAVCDETALPVNSVKDTDWMFCCVNWEARRCWICVRFIASIPQRDQVSDMYNLEGPISMVECENSRRLRMDGIPFIRVAIKKRSRVYVQRPSVVQQACNVYVYIPKRSI
jgi:hypothetical protein